MLNEHFKKVATAVKTLNSKGTSMWASLVAFAQDASTNGAQALKDNFKEQEKLATAELRVEMGKNSTYKVAKSVLVRATELGIALVDASGKPRGKTDIEHEINDKKAVKSEAEKFKIAMNTAANIAAKLSDAECITAAALVNDLLKTITPRIKIAA